SERVGGHAVLSDGTAVFVPLGDAIDVRKECSRLSEEVARLGKLVAGQRAKLANQQFVAKAPPAVVERERQKLATWEEQRGVLTRRGGRLGCGWRPAAGERERAGAGCPRPLLSSPSGAPTSSLRRVAPPTPLPRSWQVSIPNRWPCCRSSKATSSSASMKSS